MNILIISLCVVITILALLFYFGIFRKVTDNVVGEVVNKFDIIKKVNDDPILVINKSGGFVGFSHKLEIYKNGEYILYHYNEIQKQGIINDLQNASVQYLIAKVPQFDLKKIHEEDHSTTFDWLTNILTIGNISFDPTANGVPDDIRDSFHNIDLLIEHRSV